MALTETQLLKIAKILGQTPGLVDLQITLMGTMSAARQTAIEAELTLWDAGPGAVTEWARLVPKESNKGVETNPDKDADRIRMAIAGYLERPEWGMFSSSMEFELTRG